jgi:hypothetical protein
MKVNDCLEEHVVFIFMVEEQAKQEASMVLAMNFAYSLTLEVEAKYSSKILVVSGPRGVISQMIELFITTPMRTSIHTYCHDLVDSVTYKEMRVLIGNWSYFVTVLNYSPFSMALSPIQTACNSLYMH